MSNRSSSAVSARVLGHHHVLTITDAQTLSLMARNEDEFIRYMVAANSHTPYETLAVLAQDKVPMVKWRAQRQLSKRFPVPCQLGFSSLSTDQKASPSVLAHAKA